ncbi:hypothetical protein KW797_02290 [Candidatus Parcubacteria bacterium]|nr:hypothetical protein [Candidatus Parcubacteria bacterium]
MPLDEDPEVMLSEILKALHDKDFNDWELTFIESMEKIQAKGKLDVLTGPQHTALKRIYDKL